MVDIVRDGLFDGIKLAIFDHIPSNASFILPIKQLIDICKERSVISPCKIDTPNSLCSKMCI